VETTVAPDGRAINNGVWDVSKAIPVKRPQPDVQLVNDVVALYRALWGGWEQSPGDVKVSSVPELPPISPAALDSVAASATPTGR
jgi:hypothetical protein